MKQKVGQIGAQPISEEIAQIDLVKWPVSFETRLDFDEINWLHGPQKDKDT
jgi:hypothetical protein